LPIQQFFPAGCAQPAVQVVGGHAALLEVVEDVLDVLAASQARAFFTVSQFGMP